MVNNAGHRGRKHAWLFVLQDDKLKALVQKLGPNDWKHIASYIQVSLMNFFVD